MELKSNGPNQNDGKIPGRIANSRDRILFAFIYHTKDKTLSLMEKFGVLEALSLTKKFHVPGTLN